MIIFIGVALLKYMITWRYVKLQLINESCESNDYSSKGSRVYYNRVIVESKKTGAQHSVYFKCSQPSLQRLLKLRKAEENQARNKRQILEDGTGLLVNFTEIELPDNFMEAEWVLQSLISLVI